MFLVRTEEAAKDLERFLCAIGEESLTKSRFADIIVASDIGVDKSSAEMYFERLINLCRVTEIIANTEEEGKSQNLASGTLDSSTLRNLYTYHPTYATTSVGPTVTGAALTGHLQRLFDAEVEGIRKSLNRTNTIKMLQSLIEEGTLFRSFVVRAVDELNKSHLMTDGSNAIKDKNIMTNAQELTFEQMTSSLLRYFNPDCDEQNNIDPKSLFGGSLKRAIFDPFHTNADAFVSSLDDAVLGHDALNHHVLTCLSMGSYGGLYKTLSVLSNFMDAYQYFTSTFYTNLLSTIHLVAMADQTGEHVKILEENMEEEQGIYDEETIEMIRELGLDPEPLQNVPHKELYNDLCDILREKSNPNDMLGHNFCIRLKRNNRNKRESKLSNEQLKKISEPLVTAFKKACDPKHGATAATAIAAMYLGSELIVNILYSKLSCFVRKQIEIEGCPITKQDLAFFLLHIDMDVDHAEKMRGIVVDNAKDEKSRLAMAAAVDAIMEARVEFCDRFIEAVFPPTGHGGEHSSSLYNKQSNNWVRKKATCLSDFTGRPVVFQMCAPFIKGAHVLDVGCGEGYAARKLVEMGAAGIIGLDISSEMIQRAKANPNKTSKETYDVCDATSIREKICKEPSRFGIVPGRMINEGCFDLAIAIFLFNYTSISQMKKVCSQVYQLIKPGGHFIFSVPHPFMLGAHGVTDMDSADNKTFSFSKGDASSESYFSLRDRKFAGVIRTVDGRDLNVKMTFKTVSDYIDTLDTVGFKINKMHEARVLPEHVSAHPQFFATVKDSPLHLIFEVVKPTHKAEKVRIPKSISWTSYEKAQPQVSINAPMSRIIASELEDFAISTFDSCTTEETFQPTDEDICQLKNVAEFARTLRQRLMYYTGVVHVKGLDMTRLADGVNTDIAVGRTKFAYFILSSLIGKVDGSTRGLLFDVKDKGLDTKGDNVLFSVSNDKAPWHTDGASADKAYDVVGLLCINSSSEGGNISLSNSAAVLTKLKSKVPKFIINELFRPVPRDVLENGKGEGVGEDLMKISRSPQLLKLRVRHNSYPIFEEGSIGEERIRFRYMRQWIETGHIKAGNLPISPLLDIAMNALDKALDEEKVINTKLNPGDMLFCNNMVFAHAREAFINDSKAPSRWHVRIWIQIRDIFELS